jgi:hypothetical protein
VNQDPNKALSHHGTLHRFMEEVIEDSIKRKHFLDGVIAHIISISCKLRTEFDLIS